MSFLVVALSRGTHRVQRQLDGDGERHRDGERNLKVEISNNELRGHGRREQERRVGE